MTIRKKFKKELLKAIKDKDEAKKKAFKIALGELDREPTREITDERTIKIIKKLIAEEIEAKGGLAEAEHAHILQRYLPKEATDDEIKEWIERNIDFTKYKTKVQTMSIIMKQFSGRADGKRVRKILESL